MKLTIVCLLLSAACGIVQGQECGASGGVEVDPDLPNNNHGIGGSLWIEDETTYCIENFEYDGQGPDAFLYLYLRGDPAFIKGGGVYTQVPGQDRVQFEVGRVYDMERLRFTVPDGHRTCDYGAFGIWCRIASQLFTSVDDLEDHFSEDGSSGTIMCTPSPGRAYMGSLTALTSVTVGGDFFAVSDTLFAIRDFDYTAQADVVFKFFPVGETPTPTSTSGTVINGNVEAGDGSSVREINLNGTAFTCDFGYFTMLDRTNSQFLVMHQINTGQFTNNQAEADLDRSKVFCDRPTSQPGAMVGDFNAVAHGVQGTVYVVNDQTFSIQLFSYDAGAPDAYFYYYRQGQVVEDSGHGYRINLNANDGPLPQGFENIYKKITPVVVSLANAADEETVNTCDISTLTIWSAEEGEHFATVEIPQSIFTTDPQDPGLADKSRVLCSQTTAVPTPRAGAPPTNTLISTITVLVVAMVTMSL